MYGSPFVLHRCTDSSMDVSRFSIENAVFFSFYRQLDLDNEGQTDKASSGMLSDKDE